MPLPVPVAGIDFETTGYYQGETDRPMEVGLCLLHPNGSLKVLLEGYLGEGAHGAMNPYATKTHRIRQRDCHGHPFLVTHWRTIASCAQHGLCVHGKGTEARTLRRAFPLTPFLWVDTLPLARRFLHLPNNRLETVTEHLGRTKDLQALFPNRTWHQATFDAAASLLCLETLYENFPEAKTHLDQIWFPHKT